MPYDFAIWNARPGGETNATGTNGAGVLGKQDFLNLLSAQLRNQNPLEPMNDKDFIAQTAQFNTLEQLQQMTQMMNASASLNALSQSSSLIGKLVTAVDPLTNESIEGIVNEVTLKDGKPLLLVGDTVVALEDVQIVREATEPTSVEAEPASLEPEA